MKTILKKLSIFAAIVACIMVAQAQPTKPTQSQAGNLDFASKATASNNFELQAATIALAKSQDANIKQYAQMIADDHTAAGNELSTLVKNKNWQLSTMDDQKYKTMIDQLNNADPANFDRIYVEIMAKTHQEAISLFKDASTGTTVTDADLKKFAIDKIPAFEKHLNQIKNVKPAEGHANNMPTSPGIPVKNKFPKPTLK